MIFPDFDTLDELYQNDPLSYETYYRKAVGELIAHCPIEHQALIQNALQEIAKARQDDSIPREAVFMATGMMNQSLKGLNKKLREIKKELASIQKVLVRHHVNKSTT